jgi:flagellin-like hook-associated protein FlgL
MREQVNAALAALTALSNDMSELEKTNEALKDAKAQLNFSQKALEEVKELLSGQRSLLTAAQQDVVKKYEIDIYGKTKELTELQENLNRGYAELNDLKAKIVVERTRHEEILASMAALGKRLAVG